jgi:predicted ArsR family transcriptional regulator
LVLGSRFEERIYELLSLEPVTPSEMAKRVGVTYKTAQRALMHLALTRKDVAYRNSGRIHLFWKRSE